ncbi:MAG: VWA domain-containing protein [Woeseiaceae bacterium]
MIDLFHFLRPIWLIALPVIGLTWWLVRRREASQARIGDLVAPHLRDALTINRDVRKGLRAVDGISIALVAAALAAAGPTWSKQASPWFAETAPLVIAFEVSDSMRSNDFQPTRLDRARFKVMDLIAARTGSRTALVAYAGSAHIVVPPSKDADVLKPFLESLDPAIMPAPGSRASEVLALAKTLLGDQARAGTLLFVNDGFDADDIAAFAEYASQADTPSLAALVVGTDAGGVALMPDGSPVMAAAGGRLDTRIDTSLLRRISSEAKVSVVRAGTGDADIRQLMRTIQSNLQQADDPDAQWRDQGWWLLWPAALLALLWFRRGWTMQW